MRKLFLCRNDDDPLTIWFTIANNVKPNYGGWYTDSFWMHILYEDSTIYYERGPLVINTKRVE